MQKSKTEMVWPREKEGGKLRQKEDVKPPGMTGRGRLRQRWMDTINVDMWSVGAREDTQEREIWKAFIPVAVSPY